MTKALKTFVASSLLQLVVAKDPHNLSYAEEIDQSKTKHSDQTAAASYDAAAKSSVPAGFESINNNYNGQATLLDSYTKIGSGSINYNESEDSVRLSKKAQKKILEYYHDKLTDKGNKELATAIRYRMPATTKVSKFYQAQDENKVTGHFAYNTLGFYILVPYKYFKDSKPQYKYVSHHPDPTFYQPSLKSSLYGYYNHYYPSEKFQWEASGSISSGRNSFIYDINNTLTNHVNDLYLEHHGKKYTYDIGYKESDSTNVTTPYGNAWGIFISENSNLINSDFYSSYKTPLYITANKPYAVEIKHRGKVLYKGNLLQGENIIETSNFPLGTYELNIKKTDLVTGEVEETKQFFSQQGGKYNWMHSGLQIIVGLESEYFKSAFTDHTPYIYAKKGYNLAGGDVDIFYTFANDTSYIGAEYDYVSSSNVDYSIAASISQNAGLHFSATSIYNIEKSSFSAGLYDGFSNDFSSSKYINLQYKYNEKDWNLNIYGNYDFADSYNLSSTITKSLSIHDMPASTYFTLQYDSDSISYILGMSISFSVSKNVSSSFALRGSSSDSDYSMRNTTSYNNNANGLQIHNTLYFSSNSDNYDMLSTTYDTDMAKYEATLNIKQSDSETAINSGYVAIRTNLYLTPSAYLLSSKNTGEGYLIKTPTLKEDDNVEFMVNNTFFNQGKVVLIPAKTFDNTHLDIIPSNAKYSLKTEYWDEFFYPNNFYSPKSEIQKTCLASFYADIPKEYNYTFLGMEDSFYGEGQSKSVAHMPDGINLTYIHLNKDNEQCETGVVVNCNNQKKIDLGKISCKETKK